MITREIVDYVSKEKNITELVFLEKDLILHQLLFLLETEKYSYFLDNYLFKGGTCLTKCHLGYFRFSEDLDFTYLNKGQFKDKSQKQISRDISDILKIVFPLIEELSKELNLDFKILNDNHNYIQYGGSNKFVTMKLRYSSVVSNKESFVKIQINFIEDLKYPHLEKQAITILNGLSENKQKEFLYLFPNFSELLRPTKIKCYDIREILLEKNRAILTRRGIKARDFVDVYLILKHLNENAIIYKDKIVEKTKSMLNYEKYDKNLKDKKKTGINFNIGDEQNILLKELDPDFKVFMKEYLLFLNSILQEF